MTRWDAPDQPIGSSPPSFRSAQARARPVLPTMYRDRARLEYLEH
jgi:hypothetical protein